MPCSRSWLARSICRMAFFFTTPNSTRMPSCVMMFSEPRMARMDSSANGTVSGSDKRIVMGCSHDSNWAAFQRLVGEFRTVSSRTLQLVISPATSSRTYGRA